MFKLLLVVLLSWTVSGQFFRQNFNQRFQRPRFFQQPQQQFFRGQPQNNFINNGFNRGAAVDNRLGNSEYHYSWRHAGSNTKWTWGQAVGYCRNLPGGGWDAISINDANENNMVRNAIASDRVSYIWTSGQKRGNGWGWSSGQFQNIGAWSRTGGNRRPQPDNREGGENCLAVLNNIFQDGITWHDIGCSHLKPVICEKNARF